MSNYRFTLQKYVPNNKVNCPSCGRRRCATKYIDTEGIINFPDEVCLCDHVNSCGYHYPPRAYFHDNPEIKKGLFKDSCSNKNSFDYTLCKKEIIEPPVSYIEPDIVKESLSGYSNNPLFTFLSEKYGENKIAKVFKMYNVGTSNHWSGATIYWYADKDGRYRSGKVMGYDPMSGHRIKHPYNQVTWAHSLLKLQDFNMKLCLFGEHLLNIYTDKKIALVESEKTCLIAALLFPGYLWIATGGLKMGFKRNILNVLQNRDVTLFPDLGAFKEWESHLNLLQSICRKVRVSDFLETHATKEQKDKGLDIGDFLLAEDTIRDVLKQMISSNPSLQLLIDKFDLELQEDD